MVRRLVCNPVSIDGTKRFSIGSPCPKCGTDDYYRSFERTCKNYVRYKCHACATRRTEAYRKTEHGRKIRNQWKKTWLTENFESCVRTIAKASAKKRGLLFSLYALPEKSEFCPIIPNLRLDYTVGNRTQPNGAQLDRIDSTLGYVDGNVRWVSARANKLKNNATDSELLLLGNDAVRRCQT